MLQGSLPGSRNEKSRQYSLAAKIIVAPESEKGEVGKQRSNTKNSRKRVAEDNQDVRL